MAEWVFWKIVGLITASLLDFKAVSGEIHVPNCGTRPAFVLQPQGRVLHAQTVPSRGEYPWLVYMIPEYNHPFCTGTIIHPNWIMTTKNCFPTITPVDYFLLTYVMGDVDINNYPNFGVTGYGVHFHRHPNPNNELLLLKTSQPIPFNQYVNAICLPPRDQQISGFLMEIAGFGYSERTTRPSQVLKKAQVYYQAGGRDAQGDRNWYMFRDSDPAFPVTLGGGDFGGPAMLVNSTTGAYKVFGINSFYKGGIEIASQLQWIENTMRANDPTIR